MYTKKEFTTPKLAGISQTTITEHLGLYAGYVKNTNMILETMREGSVEGYARSEMQRRFAFEFNGMKNHEYYFAALEGGAQAMDPSHALAQKIASQWGSIEAWKESFVNLAKTRGVGWAMLVYDQDTDMLLNNWVDEQHLGHLLGAQAVLCLDMWEHSFVADYQPSGKAAYIKDYLDQVNWEVVCRWFEEVIS